MRGSNGPSGPNQMNGSGNGMELMVPGPPSDSLCPSLECMFHQQLLIGEFSDLYYTPLYLKKNCLYSICLLIAYPIPEKIL